MKNTGHRRIAEIKADLANAKRELRNLLRAAGDDLGCDGTGAEADALQGWIATYTQEIDEVRAALLCLIKTPATLAWLEANDPMALRQARTALRLPEEPNREDTRGRTLATEPNKSWAPEVIADSSGKWCGNALRFATKEEEAEANVFNLSLRWILVRETEYQSTMNAKLALVAKQAADLIAANKPHRAVEIVGLLQDTLTAIAAFQAVRDVANEIKEK
jgi:hypothetical protein